MAKLLAKKKVKARCQWCGDDELYVRYHDKEWGRPLRDDLALFELLNLEGFQAGLSWITILRKRENFRKAFANFSPEKILRFKKTDITRLMKDTGIVRNRLKIIATIGNARAYLDVKREEGSFARYLWSFTGNKTLRLPLLPKGQYRTVCPEAIEMSKSLQKRGFKFVGPTICYAFMQASGMVDDHAPNCWRYRPRGKSK